MGDPDGGAESAPVKVDHTYVMPREHHNPIELHATIAAWAGDRLTLWDKSQWVTTRPRKSPPCLASRKPRTFG